MQQYKSNLNYHSLLNTVKRQKGTVLLDVCVCCECTFHKAETPVGFMAKNNTTPVTHCQFIYNEAVDRASVCVCVCVKFTILQTSRCV